MTLNEAWEHFNATAQADAQQHKRAREELGEALFRFIKAIKASKFGNRFYELEDAVGEAAIKVLIALDDPAVDIEDICNFTAALTCNACIDAIRRRQNREEQVLIEGDQALYRPNRIELRKIDKLTLSSLVSRLTETDRQFVELQLEGLSDEEIGQKLGATAGAVKMRWIRIQEKLRNYAL